MIEFILSSSFFNMNTDFHDGMELGHLANNLEDMRQQSSFIHVNFSVRKWFYVVISLYTKGTALEQRHKEVFLPT